MAGCTCDPLHKIPVEIAKEMREIAECAAWYCANTHTATNKGDCEGDEKRAKEHLKLFKEFGLLSEECSGLYNQMAWEACWSQAHEHMLVGKTEAKNAHTAKMNELATKLVETKELEPALVEDLKQMCLSFGAYTAHKRGVFGVSIRLFKDPSKDAYERAEQIYQRIQGDCELVAIEFIQDRAVLINPLKPKYFAEQKLENRSDCEQEMCCHFSHFTTKTESWSETVKWKFTVAGAIAGLYFVAGGVAASLSYSKSTTHGGSICDGEKKTYDFPVKVGPKKCVIAKGIVQECTAEVPYFMIFNIGGKKYCKEGVWSGIAAGNVDYEIGETIDLDD